MYAAILAYFTTLYQVLSYGNFELDRSWRTKLIEESGATSVDAAVAHKDIIPLFALRGTINKL